MRKYIQLLLVVITVTSVLLMLLYERKYTNVKMILEVLNSFRNQETPSKPRPSNVPTHEPYFTPSPSWIHLTETLYLYSAYWHNSSANTESTTLVLAISDSIPSASDLQCYLWYRDNHEALMGNVKVIKPAGDSSDFFISCSHVHPSNVPYGVTISYKFTNSSFISVNTVAEHFQMAVCLENLPVAFQDNTLLAEFLIFYQQVGINYFIIYEMGISPLTHRLLEHAKHMGYHLDVLHWNYPKKDAGKNAQIQNCFARSFLVHNVTTVAILKIGQFLVPKRVSNLTDVIGKPDDIFSYKFNTYHFCTEYSVDIVAKTLNFPFLSLKYMKRLNKKENSDVLAYRNTSFPWNYHQNRKTKVISASDIILHIYEKCHLSQNQLNTGYEEDITMMNYKNAYFSSALYQYLEK